MHVFTQPLQGCGIRSIFFVDYSWFKFSLFLLQDWLQNQELSLPYYLNITGKRTDGFIPFPYAFVQIETKAASSRIWTRVSDFISFDNNRNVQ